MFARKLLRHLPFALLVAVLSAPAVFAQTYNPKAIRLQGADGMDQGELMRLVDLPSGAPVTKQQIDDAVHRLGDSGLFTEVRYTVGPDALIFSLKPAEGAQALPVRFSNFAWWKPGELEPLVEARVPLFRGKLPLTGQLTDQVEAALVALLAEKGIDNAHVTSRLSTLAASTSGPSNGIGAISLSIEQPQITVGKIQLTGVAPDVAPQMNKVVEKLSADEFDSLLTANEIVDNTADTHRNAGYLDVAVKAPFFSEPYKETVGYGVDASAMVYPGALYRVSAISFDGVPPELQGEVKKSAGINPGDRAGQMTLKIAEGLVARSFENHGMLDASATADVTKNGSVHTVAYHFTVVPGPVYTFAGVDLSALPPDQQQRFLHDFHVKPGAVADASVKTEMASGLHALGLTRARIEGRRNRANHTVKYVLTTQSAEAAPPAR